MTPEIKSAATAGVLSVVLPMPCISAAQILALDSTNGLHPHDVTVEVVTYQGRKAVRVMPPAPADAELTGRKNGEGGGIVVLQGTFFHNGTIEVWPVSHVLERRLTLGGSSGWPSR